MVLVVARVQMALLQSPGDFGGDTSWTSSVLHRRHALSLLGGAAAVGAAGPAFAQAEPAKPAQLVVNHSGGSMGSAMRKAFFNGFEKKYGIKVVETSPVDFGKLRAMVDSGNVEWDLTEIGGQDAIRAGNANLLEKIDPKVVDRSKYPRRRRIPTSSPRRSIRPSSVSGTTCSGTAASPGAGPTGGT
jgi:hypothetical protein